MNLTIDKPSGLVTNAHPIKTLNLTGGGKPMPVRRCVVIHYTEGGSAMSSVDWWEQSQNRKNDLGAHFIIDRDGTIYQVRSCNRTMSHAGGPTLSRWVDPKTGKKYRGLNSCSIGIELANAGDEVQHIKGVPRLTGYAGTTVMKHRNESKQKTWEKYSPEQTTACSKLCQLLVETYNLDDITGHDCIAPERKTDPGPVFDFAMEDIREACGFGHTLPVVHKA